MSQLSPQLLVTILASLTPTKYSWLASLAFLVYDHALTFDAEVANIWSRPSSFSGILFIWTRYFGLASLTVAVTVWFHGSLSDKTCSTLFWWQAVSLIVLNTSVEVILLARVYAVYNRNKKMIYGVASLRLLALAGTIVIWILYLPAGLGTPPIDGLTGCLASSPSIFFGFAYLLSSVTEVVLCLCMLYKAWQTYKNEYSSPLLKLLIQDSVLYFASIFVVLATNCLVFFVGPPGLVQIAQGWEFAIPCAMGSRLLLSMFDHTGRQHTFGGQSQQPLGAGYMLSDMRKPDLSARHVEPPVDFLPAIDMGDDTNMGSDTIGTAELMIRLGDSPTLNIL